MLKKTEAIRLITQLPNMTARSTGYGAEIRVSNKRTKGTYFTDDPQDALDTAKHMQKESAVSLEPKQTLKGPDGLRVELDAGKVIPDDPGQDTPCLVIKGFGRNEETASFNCAWEQGELGDGTRLNDAQCDWLEAIADEVDDWLTHHVQINRAAAAK